MDSIRNIRLVLAYDGSDFSGWQRQPARPTVQAAVEDALLAVTGQPAKLIGSGRTDAGVHALAQVANFTSPCPIPCANLVRALNNSLPMSIRVRSAEDAPAEFHARYSARSKIYRYRISQREICLPFRARYVWHYPYPLDVDRMTRAAHDFVGTFDFTSFAAAGADDEGETFVAGVALDRMATRETEPGERVAEAAAVKSAVRTVLGSRLRWNAPQCSLIYEVRATGFLHHMVRNIVGTLVEVGRGRMEAAAIPAILAARDRAQAGPTAPPQGLFLVQVEY